MKKAELKADFKQLKSLPRIAFDTWFVTKVSEKKLEKWQRREILVFFTKHGLSELETRKKYDQVFGIFEGVSNGN